MFLTIIQVEKTQKRYINIKRERERKREKKERVKKRAYKNAIYENL